MIVATSHGLIEVIKDNAPPWLIAIALITFAIRGLSRPETIEAVTRLLALRQLTKKGEVLVKAGDYVVGGSQEATDARLDALERRVEELEAAPVPITASFTRNEEGSLTLNLRNKSSHATASELRVMVVKRDNEVLEPYLLSNDEFELRPGEGRAIPWTFGEDPPAERYGLSLGWREGDELHTGRVPVWVPER